MGAMPKKSKKDSDKALIAEITKDLNKQVITKSARKAMRKPREDMNQIAFRVVQEATQGK